LHAPRNVARQTIHGIMEQEAYRHVPYDIDIEQA